MAFSWVLKSPCISETVFLFLGSVLGQLVKILWGCKTSYRVVSLFKFCVAPKCLSALNFYRQPQSLMLLWLQKGYWELVRQGVHLSRWSAHTQTHTHTQTCRHSQLLDAQAAWRVSSWSLASSLVSQHYQRLGETGWSSERSSQYD